MRSGWWAWHGRRASRACEGYGARLKVCETPRRWVVGLAAAEGEAGLRRLARLLHEAAGAFYLDDARRRLAAHAERRAPPPELSARVAFKARTPRCATCPHAVKGSLCVSQRLLDARCM